MISRPKIIKLKREPADEGELTNGTHGEHVMDLWNRRDFLKGLGATGACIAVCRHADAAEPVEAPWLAEIQGVPANVPTPEALGLEPLLVDADGAPIATLEQWHVRREALRTQWMDFLGPMPERPPVALTTISEDRVDGCRRVLVRYESEPGLPVEGYVLYPDPLGPMPRAGVVALHSTTPDTINQVAGVTESGNHALGLKLAREGFVVFCPRCFLWPGPDDYTEAVARFQTRHPGALGMRKMLYDAQYGVDVLCTLPEVDSARIGAIGHSLGAKETLYLAAFDDRVRAAVASEGGIGLTFTNWHDPWYLGPAIHGTDFALNHHQVLALIAPRAFLIVAGESGPPTMSVADGDRTWPFVEAALPVYRLYGGPPRIGLYNHRQGHTIPDEAYARMSEWLRIYLMQTE